MSHFISSQYDCEAPTTHRDSYFSTLYKVVRQSYGNGSDGGALNGIMPWSYGGVFRSATQTFTKYKIILAGDPPQEREWCVIDVRDTYGSECADSH